MKGGKGTWMERLHFFGHFLGHPLFAPCIWHGVVANASEGNIPGAVAQESVFRWESRESGGISEGKARAEESADIWEFHGAAVARLSPRSWAALASVNQCGL